MHINFVPPEDLGALRRALFFAVRVLWQMPETGQASSLHVRAYSGFDILTRWTGILAT
jgi:hypothetical protein